MTTHNKNIEIDNRELTLDDKCSFTLNGERIQISIDEIHNNRDLGNLSGTLAIELWAFAQPYEGSFFPDAHCMASTQIDRIYGKHFLENCQYDLALQNPPAGSWKLVLMLREYNGQFFETIDYHNFSVAYTIDGDLTKTDVKKVEKKKNNKLTKKASKKSKLNLGAKEQLAQIKGVSDKLAKRIVKNRPFKSSDELMELKGIDKKILKTILKHFKV